MTNRTKIPINFTDMVISAFDLRRVEPEKRLFCGRFGWAVHKYPIKGGITLMQAAVQDMQKTNPLLQRLMRK